jgi:transmembrane sensor
MTEEDPGTELNPIDLEAVRWVLLMESGPLSSKQQRELDAWLAESSRHQGAFVRAQAASLHLDRLATFAGGGTAVESPAPSEPDSPPVRLTRRRWMRVAAAASVIGAVGLGGWLIREPILDAWGGTRYVSNRGEVKEVKLDDGSVLTLNTETEVRVRYTHERRGVHLIRGEALFNVAHEARRPFSVRVGEWTATALGTAFTIHLEDATPTNITVTEGVVEMRHVEASYVGAAPQLARNQEALLHEDGSMELLPASDSDIAKQLAWRNHLVVFTGEPLREALREMNRYAPQPIVVEDPELAGRRIVGVFSTLDTQTFVSGMESTLGVRTEERNQTTLLLRNTN